MQKIRAQVFVQDCAGFIKVHWAVCKPGMDQDSPNQMNKWKLCFSAFNCSIIYCDRMIYDSFQMVCSLPLPKYKVEAVAPRAKVRHGDLSFCWSEKHLSLIGFFYLFSGDCYIDFVRHRKIPVHQYSYATICSLYFLINSLLPKQHSSSVLCIKVPSTRVADVACCSLCLLLYMDLCLVQSPCSVASHSSWAVPLNRVLAQPSGIWWQPASFKTR